MNEIDRKLYSFVRCRFEAAIESEPGFAEEVARFQKLNSAVGGLGLSFGYLRSRAERKIRRIVRKMGFG